MFKFLREAYEQVVDTVIPDIELVSDLRAFQKETDTMLEVPTYRQVKTYTCGFAAAAMIVHTFNKRKSIQTIWDTVTPNVEDGLSTDKLIRGLNKMKVGVKLKHKLNFEEVCRHINDGHPIAVTVKASGCSHWVVIYGVNEEDKEVLIAGNGLPHFSKHRYKWSQFKKIESRFREFLICWGK